MNNAIPVNYVSVLNDLSEMVNALYGYVRLQGDNLGEPSINSGLCGGFANAFYHCWNERFSEKVNIVFVMIKNSSECWHILIRLPNQWLFDGGMGCMLKKNIKILILRI